MERVFSAEEIADHFWPGGEPPAAAARMNRSASEWYFEKFLQEAAAPAAPNPSSNSDGGAAGCAREDGGIGGANDGESKATVDVGGGLPSDPLPAGVDPVEYAALLKQKLDMYCAVVAMSRVHEAPPSLLAPFLFLRLKRLKFNILRGIICLDLLVVISVEMLPS